MAKWIDLDTCSELLGLTPDATRAALEAHRVSHRRSVPWLEDEWEERAVTELAKVLQAKGSLRSE